MSEIPAPSIWVLENSEGLRIQILSIGAAIQRLEVPVRGTRRNVVIGLSPEDYGKSFKAPSPPYYGSIVGPHAGRLAYGTWPSWNGSLETNEGPHHLHGASGTLANKEWELLTYIPNRLIQLRTQLPPFEAGYPGGMEATVTYTIESYTLRVKLEANCSVEMPINLTQHSYFDLASKGSVTETHVLSMDSIGILQTKDMIPTGVVLPTKPGRILCKEGLDRSFVLGKHKNAILEVSDLRMKATTNQPCFHLFIGGANGSALTDEAGVILNAQSGICLENQGYPDAPNHPNFPSTLLQPGQPYVNWINFEFTPLNAPE